MAVFIGMSVGLLRLTLLAEFKNVFDVCSTADLAPISPGLFEVRGPAPLLLREDDGHGEKREDGASAQRRGAPPNSGCREASGICGPSALVRQAIRNEPAGRGAAAADVDDGSHFGTRMRDITRVPWGQQALALVNHLIPRSHNARRQTSRSWID